uniref:Uncharacterized protein n=1 Tax=Amphilophus citrinellus TaxID=61819 RepID=A0A3Q0SS55_AMPCI
MAGYTGLRSCTWTEFPAHVFNSSALLTQGSAASSCDLTLLTCLLIGSYRFCIIPLLAAFNGKDRISSVISFFLLFFFFFFFFFSQLVFPVMFFFFFFFF